MSGYALLIPELLILVAAIWALFAEMLPGKDRGAAWVGAVASFSAAAVVAITPLATASGPFARLLALDGSARLARLVLCLLAGVWMLWTAGRGQGRVREAVALALFTLLGAMFVTEARELITLVLAIELTTMPAYVLIGYRRNDVKGLEGALKYFLLSMLTTLVMLYGFSFLYGLTGTTRFSGLDLSDAGMLGVMAVLFALVGLLAKLSAAPFHYWAPDSYAGATPWTVAFVSTVPKLAGAVAIVRLVSAVSPTVPMTGTVLLVASALSMVLGNLGALTQTDVRRMMAYSGVAHSGYLLLGVAALSRPGSAAAIFYAVAYAIPVDGHHARDRRGGNAAHRLRWSCDPSPCDSLGNRHHAVLAHRHPAARRLLWQAVAVHGRTAARLRGRRGARGTDERRIGRVLPAHRAVDVLCR